MKHLSTLLTHELKQQAKSFIFILMMLTSLLTAFVCGYIQISDFQERQSVYQEEKRVSKERQSEVFVYSQFEIPVLIAPNPMSLFIKGVDKSIGNKSYISPSRLPDFETTSQRRNPFLTMFANLDISGIVKILSMFVLLLTLGLIAGEREDYTYNLVFSNSVSKGEFYLSKYIASCLSTLLALFILFFSVSILIISNNMIQTTGIFWLKIILMFLTSFLYLSTFIVLGLILSAKSKSVGMSVLWGVIIWICISFIYPNLVSTIVYKSLDVDKRKVNIEITSIEENAVKKFQSIRIDPCNLPMYHIPIGGEFDRNIEEQKLLTKIGQRSFIGISEKCILESELTKWEYLWPILWEYQQDIQNQRDLFRQKQLRQQNTNHILTCFLPDILYEQSLAILAATEYEYRDIYLRDNLRQFRGQVFEYLKIKKAFTENFFTQFPKDQWKDNWDDYTPQEKEKYGSYGNYPRLSLADVPVFHTKEMIKFPNEIFVLIVSNILLFLIGLRLFQTAKF